MTVKAPHHISVPVDATAYADAQQLAAWLSRAEGPVKLPRVGSNALAFYHAAVAKCPCCQAGAVCTIHGSAALQPSSAADGKGPSGADYQRVTSAYFAHFTKARGMQPTFRDAEGAAVKHLIVANGVERAERAIVAAFADPFWRSKATIITIAADPSRHLGDAPIQAKQTTLQADSGFQGGREVRR